MAAKKKDEKIPMVALLRVTAPDIRETIRTFDRAWHRALELPTPVSIRFLEFVRAD